MVFRQCAAGLEFRGLQCKASPTTGSFHVSVQSFATFSTGQTKRMIAVWRLVALKKGGCVACRESSSLPTHPPLPLDESLSACY